MEYVICFIWSVLALTNIMFVLCVYFLIKYFKQLKQDMNGVMTSYHINIAQLCDLIDALFEIKKDVGK